MWVMRESVPFRTEMVKEEAMKRLDHVRIVHLSWFSPVINYINYILS
jgi:hypothetical protein